MLQAHEIHAAARQQVMLADAQQARLVAQLSASGDSHPASRPHARTVALAAAARTLLNGGVGLAWGYSLKGARLGR